jgi:hypothetical protein
VDGVQRAKLQVESEKITEGCRYNNLKEALFTDQAWLS